MQTVLISVKDALPAFIEGQDYSKNVIGLCDGQLGIYCRHWLGEADGWVWAKANDTGVCLTTVECEFDDDYQVTAWAFLPDATKF